MAVTPGSVRRSVPLGPDAGRVVIKTTRAGLAAKAGHDLTIEVTRWSAQVEVPAEGDGGLAAATVRADLDLGSLEVREGTGGAIPLTDRDRREIKKQIGQILGSATATFASSRIIPSGSSGSAASGSAASGSAASGGTVEGTVTLNGKTQPARLQVTSPGNGQFQGSATVAQTGFGIKPYSGFFGALKLKDEVTLEFQLTLPES